jgi:hypothetical protein
MRDFRVFLSICGLMVALTAMCDRAVSQTPDDPYAVAEPPAGPDDGIITLIDESGEKRTFDADDLEKLPRQKVEVNDKGVTKSYEGVSLVNVLEHFGIQFGDALKGKGAAKIALCDARDDYRIAISLLEMDPATADRLVLLADRCDGNELASGEGPFRLVIPDDKRMVRSIRMLRTIRVLSLADMPMSQVFGDQPAGAIDAK